MLKSSIKKSSKKNSKYFHCDFCYYSTSRHSQYGRHIMTAKHKSNELATEMELLATHGNEKSSKFYCPCGKKFADRSGIWKHNKVCVFLKQDNENSEEEEEEEGDDGDYYDNEDIEDSTDDHNERNNKEITTELVLEVLKQNQELVKQNNTFQKEMFQLMKTVNSTTTSSADTITTNTNSHNSNTIKNSHNKTFNLHFFLNETCKDAMNITEFVESIKIQLQDLENVGETGYVNGLSKLIIKHLNALDENQRPVHCSDTKRESFYVKDKNVWEKEGPDNAKIKRALNTIEHYNYCALKEWRNTYPDYCNPCSRRSDQYNIMNIECLGGSGDNKDEKKNKIISNIAKAVPINKNNK